jgi:hypothetical protein
LPFFEALLDPVIRRGIRNSDNLAGVCCRKDRWARHAERVTADYRMQMRMVISLDGEPVVLGINLQKAAPARL